LLVKIRILVAVALLALALGAPGLTSAVNRPSETLGVADLGGFQGAAIQVTPNNAGINLLVVDRTLAANTSYTVDVLLNDACAAPGFSLTGPLGPFTTDNAGLLNAAAAPTIAAPIDQAGTQNVAVRVIDGSGVTVHCGEVYTAVQGGAGRHWW
jgi:hypothetical protein